MADENGELPNFNLPSELLVKIIDLVPISQWSSMELVSHQFQDVVHGLWGQLRGIRLDELVYNEEKKKTDPYQVVEAVLEKYLIRAPNVASISGFDEFFNRRRPIRLQTVQLLSKFEHLQAIIFSGQEMISVGNFAVFLESAASRQRWKRLDIAGGIYGKMTSQNVGGSKNQPTLNLECFKFKMDILCIFDRFLQIEWSGLKKLVLVDNFVSANKVLSIIRQCTQVTHLEIKIPECESNGQPSYVDFMQGVADLENLSVLKINGSWRHNSFQDYLLALIEELSRRDITDFALVDYYCSDQIIGAVIEHLPRLKSLELDVTKCTKASLERLANGMWQLVALKLRSSWGVIDSTVIGAIAGNMIDLQCLHLENPKYGSDFSSLGNLRKLKELRITERSVESGTVESLTRLGFGSCLETLELFIHHGISPEAMGEFLQNMPRLRSMKLRGVTDAVLSAIAMSCPKLVEFEICWSPITSTGIQSIIDHCSHLKILDVRHHYSEWFPAASTVGKYRKIAFKV